jgi:hypothetical protein
MNDTTSSQKMLLISLIIFVFIFIYFAVNDCPNDGNDLFEWFIRVIVSLAAAAMSMSLSGSINIGKKEQMKTLAEASPNITAAGSFAVFVLVYLINPGQF